jgi:type VI secretion system protein ImpJ
MARDELRVAWREGLLLRPQHFQQQERYLDALSRTRTNAVRSYPYGILTAAISESHAALGKFALEQCSGVLPDGTPFSFPDDQPPPPPIDIPSDAHDVLVYLTLQSRIPGSTEYVDSERARPDVRLVVGEQEVHDSFSDERNPEPVETASLNLNYGVTREQIEGRVCLPVARIQEVVNGQVLLEKRHIPPLLDARASLRLAGFLNDVIGRLDQRLDELSVRAVEATEGGSETFANFLLLQLFNRVRPVLQHMRALPVLHPERLYECLASLAGELTTFSRPERRSPPIPEYDHENLQLVFENVFDSIQKSLSMIIERSAGTVKLDAIGAGGYTGTITDHEMFKSCQFYLAVSAAAPAENLRRGLPSVVKIGAIQKMREIVSSALPGVPIVHIPNPPPQIRVLPGFVYFELDRSARDWQDVLVAPALGIHIAGNWPELNIELWWVKRAGR